MMHLALDKVTSPGLAMELRDALVFARGDQAQAMRSNLRFADLLLLEIGAPCSPHFLHLAALIPASPSAALATSPWSSAARLAASFADCPDWPSLECGLSAEDRS